MNKLNNYLVFSIDDEMEIDVDVISARNEKTANKIATSLGREVSFIADQETVSIWQDFINASPCVVRQWSRELAGLEAH